jgi:hypothetical protein
MYNSKQTIAISVMSSLASLAGCAGKIRYSSYYGLNVPEAPSGNDRPKPILTTLRSRMVTVMSRDLGNLVEGLVSSMQDRLSTVP